MRIVILYSIYIYIHIYVDDTFTIYTVHIYIYMLQ